MTNLQQEKFIEFLEWRELNKDGIKTEVLLLQEWRDIDENMGYIKDKATGVVVRVKNSEWDLALKSSRLQKSNQIEYQNYLDSLSFCMHCFQIKCECKK